MSLGGKQQILPEVNSRYLLEVNSRCSSEINSRYPLEVNSRCLGSKQYPSTRHSGIWSGSVFLSLIREIFCLMLFDILVPSIVFKLNHTDRTSVCYLFVCFQCKFVEFIPIS